MSTVREWLCETPAWACEDASPEPANCRGQTARGCTMPGCFNVVRTFYRGQGVLCPECFAFRRFANKNARAARSVEKVLREHVCVECEHVFVNTYTGNNPTCAACCDPGSDEEASDAESEPEVQRHECCKCGHVFFNTFTGKNATCARCCKK